MSISLTPAVLAGWRRAGEVRAQIDPFGARGLEGRQVVVLVDALKQARAQVDAVREVIEARDRGDFSPILPKLRDIVSVEQ